MPTRHTIHGSQPKTMTPFTLEVNDAQLAHLRTRGLVVARDGAWVAVPGAGDYTLLANLDPEDAPSDLQRIAADLRAFVAASPRTNAAAQRVRVHAERLDALARSVPAGEPGERTRRAALRHALVAIYQKAGDELWASRRRANTAGHVCDYRHALHAVKDLAKRALSATPAPAPPVTSQTVETWTVETQHGSQWMLFKVWPEAKARRAVGLLALITGRRFQVVHTVTTRTVVEGPR